MDLQVGHHIRIFFNYIQPNDNLCNFRTQVLAFKLFQCLARPNVGLTLQILDTHKSNYYKNPTAKIDLALSASPLVSALMVHLSYYISTSVHLPV